MDAILTCLLVAVSLSMDAFSLALIYGTYGLSKKEISLLSCFVGIFHFFMPLLGLWFGNILTSYFVFDLEFVVGIIFLVIGGGMVISSNSDDEVKILNGIFSYLLFGLSVSIDSFTTGIGLSVISKNYIGISILFMVVSGCFTYMGLRMGNRLNDRFGKYATIFGGILLSILGIFRLLKW